MEVKLVKEYNSDDYKSKNFKTSGPLSLEVIFGIIKGYENESTSMYKAIVSTYNEEGRYINKRFDSFADLLSLRDYPNPNMSFRVFYVDNEKVKRYKFHIDTSVNSNYVKYIEDAEKAEVINKKIDQELMFEEEKKSLEEKNEGKHIS